jgi:hypothetical protein
VKEEDRGNVRECAWFGNCDGSQEQDNRIAIA